MRVLVTGASGQLGSSLRRRLGNGYDYAYFLGPSRVAQSPLESAVEIADADSFESAISRASPDVIVHLAGLTGAACDTDRSRTEAINVESVKTIARAMDSSTLSRVVFASSAAVYGDHHNGPVSEGSPFNPQSAYGSSKADAEHVLRMAAEHSTSHSVVALRLFNVYGKLFKDSLVNRLQSSTPADPVPLRGFDQFVRDYVHVNDVIAAIIASIDVHLVDPFTAINVGSGIGSSNRRLVTHLEREQPIFYTVGQEVHSHSHANIEKSRALLGILPRDLP